MAEFWGDEAAIGRQMRLLARQDLFARSPWLAYGSRLLVVVDPATEVSSEISDIVEEDGIVALVLAGQAEVDAWATRHLGASWEVHSWDAFMGEAARIVPASEEVIAARSLPKGWTARPVRVPDDEEVAKMQGLNALCGVSSSPGFALRGENVPALNIVIEDEDRRLMAMAHATMMFHPQGAYGDTAFIGLVSVDPEARGLGLGVYANALCIVESCKALGCRRVTEFVARDNPASRAMVTRCGLHLDDALVAAIASRGGGRFTR